MSKGSKGWNPGQWNPGWRTKLAAAAIGGTTALLSLGSPRAYGWWGSVASAGAALIVPILAFQSVWKVPRFWLTFACLAVLQVPLVIAFEPLVERYRFGLMLAFGAVDCIFVITVIYYLCVRQFDSQD